MFIRISALGLQNLRRPRIAPFHIPTLLQHPLAHHRRVPRAVPRSISLRAREMPWRLGLY
jgi:hypothetical protein